MKCVGLLGQRWLKMSLLLLSSPLDSARPGKHSAVRHIVSAKRVLPEVLCIA
jgi:hypothetical protein